MLHDGNVAAFKITHSHIVHDHDQIADCHIVSNGHVHVQYTIIVGYINDTSLATPASTLLYRLYNPRGVVDGSTATTDRSTRGARETA
jgi:hypothetical protein